ncbi:MAG: BACON domain-containing protein, partial [Bacteroidales bacterium]|nr:BACON domain-containing protein [Bacteroidales bacterium]
MSPSSGEGDATVTITVAGASSTDETSGTVSFRSEGLSASVSVKQDAKSAIVVGDVARIPAEGGTFKVDIQYNTEYTVEIEKSAQSWITFNGTKAMQSGKLEFTFAANDGEERSGKVTVTDKTGKVAPLTITFTQDLKPVIIVGDVMGIPAEGGTFQVDIQYNTEYTVEIEKSAQSWIRYNGTKAMQSGKLEFTFAANEGDLRSGKVTVRDKSGKLEPITLTFAQEPENKIIVVGQVATVPSQGGSLEIDVRYNVDFEVIVETSATSWLHYVKTKTVSSGKLLFEVDENETTDEREGKVTLKAKNGEVDDVTLTVYQYEKKVLIVGEPSKVSFAGGFVTIPVEYNVAYYVHVDESAESWIRLYSTKSTEKGEIKLYIDE